MIHHLTVRGPCQICSLMINLFGGDGGFALPFSTVPNLLVCSGSPSLVRVSVATYDEPNDLATIEANFKSACLARPIEQRAVRTRTLQAATHHRAPWLLRSGAHGGWRSQDVLPLPL